MTQTHIRHLAAREALATLLLDGFPTSSHLYRNVIPELAKTHRVLATNIPGYRLWDRPLDATSGFPLFADVLGNLNTDLVVREPGALSMLVL